MIQIVDGIDDEKGMGGAKVVYETRRAEVTWWGLHAVPTILKNNSVAGNFIVFNATNFHIFPITFFFYLIT
jgi:hypothetical protein